MDKLKMPFGAKVLVIGAGPTGLILSQLIKVGRSFEMAAGAERGSRRYLGNVADIQMGGAASVTIAANKGIKMDIARKVEAADHYLDLERDRDAAKQQWAKLKEDNPCASLHFCSPARGLGLTL
jgi:D-arabinitol dehydrogenase (NADP+)